MSSPFPRDPRFEVPVQLYVNREIQEAVRDVWWPIEEMINRVVTDDLDWNAEHYPDGGKRR